MSPRWPRPTATNVEPIRRDGPKIEFRTYRIGARDIVAVEVHDGKVVNMKHRNVNDKEESE